jgi:hypothetical protein
MDKFYKPYFKQINTMKQTDFDKAILALLKKHKISDNEAIKLIEKSSQAIRKRNRERIQDKVAGRLRIDERPDLESMK